MGVYLFLFICNLYSKEPKPEAEIKEFVKQYNVEFEMFSKINVNGEEAHPLYKYLKSKVDGTFGNFIKWNFSKFLIDRNGIPVKRLNLLTLKIEFWKIHSIYISTQVFPDDKTKRNWSWHHQIVKWKFKSLIKFFKVNLTNNPISYRSKYNI